MGIAHSKRVEDSLLEKPVERLTGCNFDDGAKYWTKPILVGGLIYCRSSNGGLVCRDHREGE